MPDLGSTDFWPLAFALILGGAIGLEREVHGRPAGLRTHILVCLSSTMLIMISHRVDSGGLDLGEAGRVVLDPNRMGAGIVTGVGFLGASTVLRSGDFLRGLTTAACIWYVAGLGIVLGNHDYALGIVGTTMVLAVLTVFNRLANRIRPTIYRRLIVDARHASLGTLASEIRAELERENMLVFDVASGHDNERGEQELVFYLSLKNEYQSARVTERVAAHAGVLRARWKQITTTN